MRPKRLLVWLLIVAAMQAGIATLAAAQPADTLRWSATTYEAATSKENKKMLAGARRKRITGEVVDVSCYLQLGKHGTAHAVCAAACVLHGQPIGLLTRYHNLYILFPEEHHPRRDGKAEIMSVFIPLMGQTVTLTGTATKVRGARNLFLSKADVEGIKVVDAAAAQGARPVQH
jgi:hypothetical protein